MQALTPWTGLAGLRREMDRLFDRFWEPEGLDLPALGEWSPRLDLTENREAVIVKAEVPGIDPKDIQVTLEGQVLTIRGERKQEREEKGERFHRRERSYGSFARSLRLPAPVEEAKVNAAFKHGVLTIQLPKKPEAKGTTIAVKAE